LLKQRNGLSRRQGKFAAPEAELIIGHDLHASLVLNLPSAMLRQNGRTKLWPAACFPVDDVFFFSPLHHLPDADV
jgi:hypothetical protein